MRPFDEDDMSNFAFERFDDDEKSDEDLLNDWSTEGPEDESNNGVDRSRREAVDEHDEHDEEEKKAEENEEPDEESEGEEED